LNKDFSASSAIRQSGFIAQEVVKAANETGYDFNGVFVPSNENNENYSIAYSQFVVPLVKAVQELSKQNDQLKKEMEELKAAIVNNTKNAIDGSIKLTSGGEATLFQNVPNPFNQTTVIRYSIPSTAKNASLIITSLDGSKIKEFDIKNNKGQSVEISGRQLSAGTYIYSLIIDDVIADSKKMILTQ